MSQPAKTPVPPYYAVIFTSLRTEGDNGYAKMAEEMLALAKEQPGFLGFESARNEIGISVSYWQNLDAIYAWKGQVEHAAAQKKAALWYRSFRARVAKVEKEHGFGE